MFCILPVRRLLSSLHSHSFICVFYLCRSLLQKCFRHNDDLLQCCFILACFPKWAALLSWKLQHKQTSGLELVARVSSYKKLPSVFVSLCAFALWDPPFLFFFVFRFCVEGVESGRGARLMLSSLWLRFPPCSGQWQSGEGARLVHI